MIRFKCPSCEKLLQVPDQQAGKKAKCACGTVTRIPQPKSAHTPVAVPVAQAAPTAVPVAKPIPSSPQPPAMLTCPACSAKLRAPAGSEGKKIRCKCGHVFVNSGASPPTPSAVPVATPIAQPAGIPVATPIANPAAIPVAAPVARPAGTPVATPVAGAAPVPVAQPAPLQPAAPPPGGDNSWLDDLPNPAATSSFRPAGPAAMAPRPAAPAAAPNGVQNYQNAIAGQHLHNAAVEQREKAILDMERGSSGGGSMLNGGVIGGLLMMILSAVWFVGGLMAGFIFFYPPVLFVIGLASFIGGLFGLNDDD